jgi:hypothetical protein
MTEEERMPTESVPGEPPRHSPQVHRRNRSLALALVCFALSSLFIFGLDGHMVWLMWRDAPIVAAILFAGAVFFAVRWWRTPRT